MWLGQALGDFEKMAIHNDVERENEELRRRVAELEAKKGGGPIRFKVTEKGGVSVYGLGRFPVTLYQGQWKKLLAAMPELEKFIEEHRQELSTKD
jgi:hypothetical protein